jgi:hypothetical protein
VRVIISLADVNIRSGWGARGFVEEGGCAMGDGWVDSLVGGVGIGEEFRTGGDYRARSDLEIFIEAICKIEHARCRVVWYLSK